MSENNYDEEVPAIKDGTAERLVPSRWRSTFCNIVNAFVSGDYLLVNGVPNVEVISEKTAAHIQSYIREYGATLTSLSKETWNSSVCIWTGTHWDVLVDLYTEEEGPSDLVLSAQVIDTNPGFQIAVYMVYVP
ncbi:hypothetical protein [Undibacterium sp.]|uniref:DUF7668 domain-containing protein n=1 Tax=Undibacterium sp. TaxID=1914977 RepID=UPI00374DA1F2